MARTVEAYGRIDRFVNNASINGVIKPTEELTFENYQTVLGINVTGAAIGRKHVVAQRKTQGSGTIVTSASNGRPLGDPARAPVSP
ncbi:hypothetical protein GCM10011415_22190 [Salipiger pallidus]|uniref:Short chain dehydrogenase n=1 Tax=Salipiger pallidus TaxID=1775170 RepID=A0A8J2ZKC0_9RHOB|nr:SDR family NAD(P)-dependent oxidoreductase [Salipiger pallidus]GGG73454.1 hypothetical protein GCM10011415_22190 [Salipiger pallidus]